MTIRESLTDPSHQSLVTSHRKKCFLLFQSFHHAQILQGEEGAVGLAEVERHGVDESGDVGAVHVHHVREVEKAGQAAGKVFGDVAARQRLRAFDGQVRWVFRERFIERFGAGPPEGVQCGKKGRELQTEGFSDGEALLVALFHEGGRALREGAPKKSKSSPFSIRERLKRHCVT